MNHNHDTLRTPRGLTSLLLIGLTASGLLLSTSCSRGPHSITTTSESSKAVWHCPMHPQITSDRPGTCPICHMNLVQDEPGSAAEHAHPPSSPALSGQAAVTLRPERLREIGLRTATARVAPIATSVRTTGRVTFDEERLHHLHVKYEAYVDTVWANFVGAEVRRGDPLLSLYSPDLFAAEQEFLLALRVRKSLGSSTLSEVAQGGRDLVESARQRLLLWDLSEAEVQDLEARGTPNRTRIIKSPISGFVIGKMATHGMKVSPQDSLFDIADLSRVWVLADVFEAELPRIRVGQAATMTLSYWPGRSWRGRVGYIFPTLDEKTRTAKVRLSFDNTQRELKPEMFANVVLHSTPRRALGIPEDAILDGGLQKLVFVVEPEDPNAPEGQSARRLIPRQVTTGEVGDGLAEIRAGLSEGESVATGANFLIDSESRLRAALSGMGGALTPPAHHATPLANTPATAPAARKTFGSQSPPPASRPAPGGGHAH